LLLRKDWALASGGQRVVPQSLDRLPGRADVLEDLAVEAVKFTLGGIEAHTASFDDDNAGRQVGALDYESISHKYSPVGPRLALGNSADN
jgi:hypothetical protein